MWAVTKASATLVTPLVSFIDQAKAAPDMAAWLTLMTADNVYQRIEQGMLDLAKAADVSQDLVRSVVVDQDLQARLDAFGAAREHAVAVWNENQHTAGFFVQGFIGGLIDGYLGTTGVGEAISDLAGGEIRKNRLQLAVEAVTQAFVVVAEKLDAAGATLDADPRFTPKDGGWAGCLIALVIVAILLIGGAYGLYRVVRHFFFPDPELATTAPPPQPTSSPTSQAVVRPNLNSLAGVWKTTGGRELFARIDGEALMFSARGGRWEQDGYKDDEWILRLRGNGEQTFVVQHKFRPVPKPSKYGVDALESCTEIATAVGEKPLGARLADGVLTIDIVQGQLAAGAFSMAGGTVARCSMDKVARAKGELVLTKF